MNEFFGLLGIQSWKPVMSALLLPPVPLLLLVLLGGRMMFWRRGLAWLVLLLACAGLWLSACAGAGHWMQQVLLQPPPVLGPDQIASLRKNAAAGRKVAIVVLGGGRETLAPEYGVTNLTPDSLVRLHYAQWLAKQTNIPMAFSGGVGWGEPVGVSEAEAAERIAERDYGRPLKWHEAESRDTRENATRTVAMLKAAGITDLVIVTNGWHMRRAMRAFEGETQRADAGMSLVAAPMGMAAPMRGLLAWMPSATGFRLVNRVLHEVLGNLAGA